MMIHTCSKSYFETKGYKTKDSRGEIHETHSRIPFIILQKEWHLRTYSMISQKGISRVQTKMVKSCQMRDVGHPKQEPAWKILHKVIDIPVFHNSQLGIISLSPIKRTPIYKSSNRSQGLCTMEIINSYLHSKFWLVCRLMPVWGYYILWVT
jgi:hypothetical protein